MMPTVRRVGFSEERRDGEGDEGVYSAGLTRGDMGSAEEWPQVRGRDHMAVGVVQRRQEGRVRHLQRKR